MSRPQIVVATDLSPESERAFGPAGTLAKALAADVVLLHVVTVVPVVAVDLLAPAVPVLPTEVDLGVARNKLHEMAARIPAGAVSCEVLSGTDVAGTIADFVRARKASYLVITTHGRSGVRRLLMGSVAESVLRQVKLPIVVVPM